jgi:hypothetical protein
LDSSAVERRCFIASTAILGAIRLTVIVPEPFQVTLRAGAVFFRDSFPGDFCLGDVGMAFPARAAIVRADSRATDVLKRPLPSS